MNLLAELEYRIGNLERRLNNTNRIGVISEVDTKKALARVRYAVDEDNSEVLSNWLPWFERMAGEDRTWSAPCVGEQVMLLGPGGEITQAVILRGIFQEKFSPTANQSKDWRIDWQNGYMHHDNETGVLTIGATDLKVIGGNITAVDGDVIAENISLKHHVHSGIKRGFSNTEKAQ